MSHVSFHCLPAEGQRSGYQESTVIHLFSRGKACVHIACFHKSSVCKFGHSGVGGPGEVAGEGDGGGASRWMGSHVGPHSASLSGL